MKPISITMQGFGSYIQSTTIDFFFVGRKSYLFNYRLHGRRKTTILDAMCFALYCKATGGRRSWSSMRSTAADDALSTSVDFSFQLGSEVYRFYRSQSVYYVRGSGRRDIRKNTFVIASLMACPPINRLTGNCWSAAVKPKCATMHSDCLTDLRTIFSSDCIAARGFSKTAPCQFQR